jgi:hypothetical protein
MLTAILMLLLNAGPIDCATRLFSNPLAVRARPTPGECAPARPGIGESRLLWLQNMSVMPPVQVQANVTCRGIGAHCYVLVEDSAWTAGQMDSADVGRIIERFDRTSPRDSTRGVWQHNTSVLGQPPDAIDQDSLVYLIYYNVGTFHGYSFDGFWQYFDEFYDTTAMRRWGYHSNEIECVYLDCWPQDPSTDYRIAIAAHEFGHMIQWNYDPAESLWVNEGFCELAMWLFGAPDDISGFNTNPDNDLTAFDGDWADYIKTYLWSLYLYEQYGGRVGTDLVHNIIASPAVSIAGVDSGFSSTGLNQRFDGAFDDWVLANIIADTTLAGGRFGYFGEAVPRFSCWATHSTYPVSRTGSLSRWAGEYSLFTRGRDLALSFDGADGANYRLFVVGRDTLRHALLLDTVELDSLQRGSASVPGSDSVWQQVYLVPVSHYPYGTTAYSYSAAATGVLEPPPAGPAEPSEPNPSLLRCGAVGASRLYSADGRRVSAATAGPGIYWLDLPGRRHKVLLVR